jgi:predicted ATPase
LVLIGGESGIGKTRLASELALMVEAEGGRVLWGNATAESAPYQAIIQALRSALPLVAALDDGTTIMRVTPSVPRAKDLPSEPLWLAAIASLIPELRTRLSNLPTLVPLDPERERARLFESLVRCVEGLAQPRPLLLLLDDLHWAGATTFAWLEFLANRLANLPVLVVGTYREEEAAREHPLRAMRRRLQKANLVSHLALGRLDAGSVEKIAERFAPTLGQTIYGTSEGNPFFVNELIRDWIESGKTVPTPSTIATTIAGRLTHLSEAARHLCEVAAVIGTSFDIDLVCQVAGWSEAQTLDALDELLDHQLLREAGGRSRFDYAFTHHLIQSTVYTTLPNDTRTRRHRRVAHVMEELSETLGEEFAGERARHWDRGGEPEHAAENYLRAARYALALYADDEALVHIQRALELTAMLHLQMQLRALRETIYARRGERELQRADLVQLRELAQTIGDENLICDTLRRAISFQRALGDRQAEAALIAELKMRVVGSASMAWQAEALREQATYQTLLSQYDTARPIVEEALGLYQSLDDVAGQVQSLCLRAEIGIWQGRFDLVQASLDRALALSQVYANQSLLVQTLRTASAAAFTQQDFNLANNLGEQMLDLSRRIGDLEGEADALTRLGSIAARWFQIRLARERYQRAAELYGRLGKKQGQAAVLINAGLLAANRLGRYAEGLAQFRQAERIFVELNDRRGQLVCALNLGMTAFFLGDLAEAKSAAQQGLALARQISSPAMEANALANLGAAERELGELTEAIEHMEAGLAIRRSLEQPADLGTDLCDLTLAYLRANALQAAQRTADELLTLYATHKSMDRPEYILWVAAQTRHALGDNLRARDLLAQAYTVLRERATAIPDEESRTSFLQFRFNREILTAYEKQVY